MNLVVGSTGMVGMEMCRLLAAGGNAVKALVRTSSDPAKVEKLKALGATVVRGDLRDPQSLKAACQGGHAVITTAATMPFAYDPADNTLHTTDRDAYLRLIAIAADARRVHHPMFGALTRDEWMRWGYAHVDHHLRQFGL